MFSIPRWNRPPDIRFAASYKRFHVSMQVDIQQFALFSAQYGAGAKTFAIGGPVDSYDARPLIRYELHARCRREWPATTPTRFPLSPVATRITLIVRSLLTYAACHHSYF
jgi:hypothetical protein